MAARIDRGRARLLTRTGLDWTDKYPSTLAALAKVRTKAAYLDDGELCGVGDDGLPSFSQLKPRATASVGCGSSTTPSTFSILMAATPQAYRSSSARRFWSL